MCRRRTPSRSRALTITNQSGPAAPAVGHRVRGVGAGRVPRRRGAVRRHGDRSREPRDARVEPLERRVRRARRVRRPRRPPAVLDGRSEGIPGPPRHARSARGALARPAPHAIAWAAASTPCGALQTTLELGPNGTAEIVFVLGEAATKAEALALVARYRTTDLDAVLRAVTDALAGRAGHRAGAHAGPRDGRDAQWLAAVPDARLPRLGARGALSGERRLRLSRPAPGRHGAQCVAARDHPRAPAAGGRPAIRRRRRPALVAPDARPGRAHPGVGRPAVAGLRHGPVHRSDRRPSRARRARAVSRGPGARRRPARIVLSADHGSHPGHPVRALRACPGHEPGGRPPRAAAHRHG